MFNKFKVGTRLFLLVAVTTVITTAIALSGFFGMLTMKERMQKINDSATVPLVQLGTISRLIGANAAHVYRALQHDPIGDDLQYHLDHPASEHLDRAEANMKKIDELWQAYSATSLTPEEKQLVDQFTQSYGQFVKEVLQPTIDAARADDFSYEVRKRFGRGYRDQGAIMGQTIDELVALQEKVAAEQNTLALQAYEKSSTTMSLVFAAGLLLSITLAWGIIRSIVRPLTALQATMTEVEQTGDFTRSVIVSSADEVGQTAASFNQLLGALRKALSEILQHTGRLDEAATELSTTAQQAAQGSAMTSESSSAMAASVEEMTVSISHVSENARETSGITQHTDGLSKRGGEVIHQAVREMQAMADAVRESSDIINELGKQSEHISGIVKVIKEVADQTNLLALNAAIEAARAGDQGRGFSVVADEVRKLAERTTNATGEISSMIGAIQSSSQAAVTAMGLAAQRVESGVSLADQAGRAITDIQHGAGQVQTHVSDITSALAEQNVASQTISQQVERVAQAAEQNSAAARSSSDAAVSIEQLARQMRQAVAGFRV